MPDYNLALELVDLTLRKEASIFDKCDSLQNEIDRLEGNLSKVQELLAVISSKRMEPKQKEAVDLSDQKELVDEVRLICPKLLPNGVYTLQTSDQVDILVQGLEAACSQITREISPNMLRFSTNLDQLPNLINIVSKSLENQMGQINRFISSQLPR